MFSSTVNNMKMPTSRCSFCPDVHDWCNHGRSCGHVPAEISMLAAAAMTRAAECRTSLLQNIKKKSVRVIFCKQRLDRLLFSKDHGRKLVFDLRTDILGQLHP